jgi:hypothetical protein
VLALVAAEDGVLAGGSFNGFDSRPRTSVAAIDLDTGGVLPFDAHPEGAYGYADVAAVATQGRSVFTAGDFDRIGGRRRRALAKLDALTGKAQPFDARVGWRAYPAPSPCMAANCTSAAPSAASAAVRDAASLFWTPAPAAPRAGTRTRSRRPRLVINGHTLYVTGAFTRLGGTDGVTSPPSTSAAAE